MSTEEVYPFRVQHCLFSGLHWELRVFGTGTKNPQGSAKSFLPWNPMLSLRIFGGLFFWGTAPVWRAPRKGPAMQRLGLSWVLGRAVGGRQNLGPNTPLHAHCLSCGQPAVILAGLSSRNHTWCCAHFSGGFSQSTCTTLSLPVPCKACPRPCSWYLKAGGYWLHPSVGWAQRMSCRETSEECVLEAHEPIWTPAPP